jgi:hypothetical protein
MFVKKPIWLDLTLLIYNTQTEFQTNISKAGYLEMKSYYSDYQNEVPIELR